MCLAAPNSTKGVLFQQRAQRVADVGTKEARAHHKLMSRCRNHVQDAHAEDKSDFVAKIMVARDVATQA